MERRKCDFGAYFTAEDLIILNYLKNNIHKNERDINKILFKRRKLLFIVNYKCE